MCDGFAEQFGGGDDVAVAKILVYVRVVREVVVVRVNGSILRVRGGGYISPCIVCVDWRSFDDMLILKR